MSDATIEKTFQVPSPAKLELGNLCGSVELRPGEDGSIHVTAVKRDGRGNPERTAIEMTQNADGTVVVRTRFPEAGWSWLFGAHPCDVDYVVTAPRRCDLKLRGVSSSADVSGFEGSCALETVSGEVRLSELSGELSLRSVSGDIAAERLAGPLALNTVSGNLTVQAGSLASVRATAVSGDVCLESPLGDGPYAFDSVSGDVRLIVPPETRCTAELSSVSGTLFTDFPATGTARSGGTSSVAIRGGGTRLTLRSVSGDLSLECRGPVPGSAEARRSVLERLEQGELSVEEAVSQLKG